MITKNFRTYNLEEFLQKLKKSLEDNGFNVQQIIDMMEKKGSFPKVLTMEVIKGEQYFKIGIVMDKNGITITIPIKDKKLKQALKNIIETLSV
ncbi:hypothetical protein [Persephonella sp.]|uniref:hypothetical protein n=1 Tax=Persephonella sp. TaxID=2060922 RepID=UPI00262582AB|nr:hypothetical protein [Persephonella sp.]